MVRLVCPRVAAAMLIVSSVAAAAAAQELQPSSLRQAAQAITVPAAPSISVVTGSPAVRRPSPLVPLYVSFGTLQALDGHSTLRALDRGAVEANPLMKGIAGNPAALFGIKAGATTGVIYISEKMWKKNKTAAVVFMVAANSAMAWVVQHNYRAVR